jgi:hypothetical protein
MSLNQRSVIPLHIQYDYIYTCIYMAHSHLLFLPLAVVPLHPFVSPFVFPSTYLALSSCDRNRPPPSQVACKLTPFAPPYTQLTHPPQFPRTPPALRLTTTTSGIFRLLLSGTIPLIFISQNKKRYKKISRFANLSLATRNKEQ